MTDTPENSHRALIKGKKVLVVDDHRNIRLSLRMALDEEGAIISEAETYAQALIQVGKISKDNPPPFDAILLDIRLPDGSGLDFLKLLSHHGHASRVIMISGEGTVKEAFQATQMGAFDYIEKPFTPERILVSLGRCLDFKQIQALNQKLNQAVLKGQEIIGESAPIQQLRRMITKVAATNGRVLVLGESGTGKELIAKSLHRQSDRSAQTLVKVNCAAIPQNLVESELFGHEKGAFTGAIRTKKGLFEQADDGTLFLDEIGELDLNVQAKLLRVLQNGEINRVGGEKVITVDVRLIAATHRDLEGMIESGQFREDLYYRLNVVTLHSPPLRERGSDIHLLAHHFLTLACEEHSVGTRTLGPHALEQIMAYHWPGNIRELKNTLERVVILSESEEIDEIPDLTRRLGGKSSPRQDTGAGKTRMEAQSNPATAAALTPAITAATAEERFGFETGIVPWEELHHSLGRSYIRFVLSRSKGNVSEAARVLCLERAYLHRLMKKYNIQRDVVVSD